MVPPTYVFSVIKSISTLLSLQGSFYVLMNKNNLKNNHVNLEETNLYIYIFIFTK